MSPSCNVVWLTSDSTASPCSRYTSLRLKAPTAPTRSAFRDKWIFAFLPSTIFDVNFSLFGWKYHTKLGRQCHIQMKMHDLRIIKFVAARTSLRYWRSFIARATATAARMRLSWKREKLQFCEVAAAATQISNFQFMSQSIILPLWWLGGCFCEVLLRLVPRIEGRVAANQLPSQSVSGVEEPLSIFRRKAKRDTTNG